jgi:hypothetical protein
MNNTLGLGIFASLVYFQNLDWQYSAGMFISEIKERCLILIFFRGDSYPIYGVHNWNSCNHRWFRLQPHIHCMSLANNDLRYIYYFTCSY